MSLSRRKIYWALTSVAIILVIAATVILNEGSTEESNKLYAFTDQPELISDNKEQLKYSQENDQYWGRLPDGEGSYTSRFSPSAVESINVPNLEKKKGIVIFKPLNNFEYLSTDANDVEEINAVMINGYRFETRTNESNYCRTLTTEFYVDEEKVGEIDVENTDEFKNYSLSLGEKGFIERILPSSPNKSVKISLKDKEGCSYWQQTLLIDKLELN